jgi:hypothetical protein
MNVERGRLIYNVEWLQHSAHASRYDYQVAFLSSQFGLHIFCCLAPEAVKNQHGSLA